ncbi:CBS domain-containing protein CBSX1, chloroplastic [Linum grandiflorum]
MDSLLLSDSPSFMRLPPAATLTTAATATATSVVSFPHRHFPSPFQSPNSPGLLRLSYRRFSSTSTVAASGTLMASALPNGVYTVGDFMTKKEDLCVVKPTTTVDEALETLVECRITGFPVIDDDWKLVGLVSDYDLLALDSISGQRAENDMFPEVDSTWKLSQMEALLKAFRGNCTACCMTINQISSIFHCLTPLCRHLMRCKSCSVRPTEKLSVT